MSSSRTEGGSVMDPFVLYCCACAVFCTLGIKHLVYVHATDFVIKPRLALHLRLALHYNRGCIKLNGFEDCTFIRWAAIDQQLDAG